MGYRRAIQTSFWALLLVTSATMLAWCGAHPDSGQETLLYPGVGGSHLNGLSALAGPGYVSTVMSDNPVQFFELTDTSGTVATNDVNSGNGTYMGSYALAATPGPLASVSK